MHGPLSLTPYSDKQDCIVSRHRDTQRTPPCIDLWILHKRWQEASASLAGGGGAGWCVADDNLWQCGFLHPSV